MNPLRYPTALVAITLFALTSAVPADEHAASLGSAESLARLQEGNQRYVAAKVTEGKPVAVRRAEVAQAQHPFAIVVGCADSRTAPELLFDQNLGDLFVVRSAGNLVDDHALGSIEYAVAHLGARLIVVLGHERCGAVAAAIASDTAPGHINSIVHDIHPAVEAVKGHPGDALANTVLENAKEVAGKIRSEAKLGDLGSQVRIVSAVYDLDTGVVDWSKE